MISVLCKISLWKSHIKGSLEPYIGEGFVMKEEIEKHINELLRNRKKLTEAQLRMISYWEFVDYEEEAKIGRKIR